MLVIAKALVAAAGLAWSLWLGEAGRGVNGWAGDCVIDS
jgi:hypothetical protein